MSEERAKKNPSASGVGTVNDGVSYEVRDGAVLIAAITSCTNTSNPSVMLGAALLARNAAQKGLKAKPWVKTSLSPGSKVVTDYLTKAQLLDDYAAVGFHVTGYGCMTCIGNSGPLKPEISTAVKSGDVIATSVLSGNRNFEGRVHPEVKMNFLASPPLVVAYALAGTTNIDLNTEPLGTGSDGKPVFLKDIWPSPKEVADTVRASIDSNMFRGSYGDVFAGDANWQAIKVPAGNLYEWDDKSTYVRNPRRLGHHRPHLARGRHRQGKPGCEVPRVARRSKGRLQLVRRTPRQPRGHDAWHLCQHPPQKSAGSRN
jgi:aconitate hydratase